MAKRDCYDVLGVPRSASKDDIKKAYRKLALKYHPDKTKGDKTSEEKFKEASEAYHILSDEKRKANYDQFGHAAFEGGSGGGQGFGGFDTSSFSDIFEDFFSDFGGGASSRRSSNRGNDLRYDVTISMEEAYSGLLPSNFPIGIQLGSNNTWLGFHGEHQHGLALNIEGQNSENFYTVLNGLAGKAPESIPTDSHYGKELRYIIDMDANANIYAEAIETAFNNKGSDNLVSYPDTDLANQLKTVARLIRGGIETKIYMVTIGGFDTHNQQNQSAGDISGKHTDLLTELSQAVDAFVHDINSDSIGDDVIGLTFSEFGRKAKQNGNLGTDHGEIAPMFVFGKPVKGGISGINVDLTEASDNNNWQITTVQHDYRQVFATLMQDFLGAKSTVIDNAFFDQTNKQSFVENKISNIINSSYFVDSSCYSLGLALNSSETFWAAYPNPVNDLLFLNPIIKSTALEFRIFNSKGQILKKGKLDFESSSSYIDLSMLKREVYLIELNDGVHSEVKKIIKA